MHDSLKLSSNKYFGGGGKLKAPYNNGLDSSISSIRSIRKKKCAFTLAEVLITLGVIGVVAAITMPTVIANINERVNSERQANIAQKITQAMEQMRAHGLLNTQYASTDAFVDELQKYLKIAKRCNASNIAECWPTTTIIDHDGNEYEVANAKTGEDLGIEGRSTNNVGLILADGASIIMTYDENAGTLDVGDKVVAMKPAKELPVGGGKMKEFPGYTTSVTGAIDFVMDVNGKTNPNREFDGTKYYDIRSFKTAHFSVTDLWENGPAGKILYLGGPYTALNCSSSNSGSADYTTYCNYGGHSSGYENDYWAGAIKTCAEQGGTLPSLSKLQEIYNNKGEYPSIASLNYQFWSSDESPYMPKHEGRFVRFDNGGTGSTNKANQPDVVCVK